MQGVLPTFELGKVSACSVHVEGDGSTMPWSLRLPFFEEAFAPALLRGGLVQATPAAVFSSFGPPSLLSLLAAVVLLNLLLHGFVALSVSCST